MQRDEQPSPVTTAPEDARVHFASSDDLCAAADPGLTEDLALALLKRADLPAEVLEQLAKNGNVLKQRKVKVALVCHPNTRRATFPCRWPGSSIPLTC